MSVRPLQADSAHILLSESPLKIPSCTKINVLFHRFRKTIFAAFVSERNVLFMNVQFALL